MHCLRNSTVRRLAALVVHILILMIFRNSSETRSRTKMATLTAFLKFGKHSRLSYKHLAKCHWQKFVRSGSYYPINDNLFGLNEEQQQVGFVYSLL